METRITPKQYRLERIHYNSPDFPAYIRLALLSAYPNYSAVSHWHDDAEFIVVLSGRMLYNVNGSIVALREGDGIFVNARQLHHGFSEDRTECAFLCILLHPMLLCPSPYVEREYVVPLLSNSALSHLPLRPCVAWENGVLEALREMYDCAGEPASALRILGLFCRVWSALYEHAPREGNPPARPCSQLFALKDMVGYIQSHYQEKITLDGIASAGKVCKSSCCAIFRHYLNQTPIAYLTDYRLKKSVGLMEADGLTITEISLECGFSGASYYAETFHKRFGCSPTEYRRRQGNRPAGAKGANFPP